MLGDMPLPAKFFIAFVLVLALIGGVAWLLRRFGSGALNSSAGRNRQARLGVIEATAVDSRRRLVLIRRDNIEHLIMLGGPTDLVVEANIVRAHAAAGREAPPPRAPEPAGWPAQSEAGWPAAPEPAQRPVRGAERTMPPAVADDLPLQPYPEPAAREPAPRAPSGDRLAGLAAELARAGGARVEPQVARPEPPARRPVEARRAPAPPRQVEETHAGDEHLASMAQQLEAALRRPAPSAPAAPRDSSVNEPRAAAPTVRRPVEPRERNSLIERAKQARSSASLATPRARDVRDTEPPAAPEAAGNNGADLAMVDEPMPPPAVSAAPAPEPVAETSAPAAAGEHAEQPPETKSPRSLEEEMANLLGRSPGRT